MSATDDFVKIQWAVDNASAGDMIIVRDGAYTGINVEESLTIKSENGAEATIVQAPNPDEHAFGTTAEKEKEKAKNFYVCMDG